MKNVIRRALNNKEIKKQHISLALDENLLHKLDKIIKHFRTITDSRISSRQQIIEVALEEFIKDANQVLSEDYGINIDETEDEEVKNVLVVAGDQEGFNKIFLVDNQWYEVKIAEFRRNRIEYIACYVTAPVSSITHYAKVTNIEYIPENGKFKVGFEKPIELPQKKITLDHSNPVRSTTYTTLNNLTKARYLYEL